MRGDRRARRRAHGVIAPDGGALPGAMGKRRLPERAASRIGRIMDSLSYRIITFVIALNLIVAIYFLARFGFVWMLGRSVDRDFTLRRILAMRRLGLDPRTVIRARDLALRLAINVPIDHIQRHYEHGGDPARVIQAMRHARDQGRSLGWEGACHIDLEGQDLEEAARTGLDPSTGESLTR